jgi:hypothetical protein
MRRMMAAGVRPDAGRAARFGASAWATGGFDRLADAARDIPLLKTPERSWPHATWNPGNVGKNES